VEVGGLVHAALPHFAPISPSSRLYGLATDRDQGRLPVDSIAGFAQRTL
jgi:hypothetical protein